MGESAASSESIEPFERDSVMSTYDATMAQSIVLHTNGLTEGFLRAVYEGDDDNASGLQGITDKLDEYYHEIAAMDEAQRRHESRRELASLAMKVSTGRRLVAVDSDSQLIIDQDTSAALDMLLRPVYTSLDEQLDKSPHQVLTPERLQESADINRYAAFDDQARCRDADPEVFFPDVGGDVGPVKKICADCPVITECFDAAVTHGERFGVFGGSSENDRRKIKQQLHKMRADSWDNLDFQQRRDVLRRAGVLHLSYFSEGDIEQETA